MNTFASTTLQGLLPFELVFARKPRHLTSFEIPRINTFPTEYKEFFQLLMEKAKMYRNMDLEWRTLQSLELTEKNKMMTYIEAFKPNDLVYLLASYSSSLQSSAQKFRQDYVGLCSAAPVKIRMRNKERVFTETLTNEQHEAHTLHTIGGNYGCAPTNQQTKMDILYTIKGTDLRSYSET